LEAFVGNHVTFWSPHWAQENSLSGGPAPNSFKGFAKHTNPTPPECGGTWTSSPGNSAHPPHNVPNLITAIASSRITQTGPTIMGDIPIIVLIETDEHNDAVDDGGGNHDLTGTVVAIVCTTGATPTPGATVTPTPPFEGSFIIGDLEAVVGNHVTFWSDHWSDFNDLSGGEAPDDFKGFAKHTDPRPPECGGTWTSPRNQHRPAHVPDLITAIATSSITDDHDMHNGNFMGDIRFIVLIQTDGHNDAIDNGGGHQNLTGTVVAIICGAGPTPTPGATVTPTPPFEGSFVIGDLEAMVGNHVTFWSDHWSDFNDLSGGEAPDDFKGFAKHTDPRPPECGGTWTSPRNQHKPAHVPELITAIATSSITDDHDMHNGNFMGDIRFIVLIQTDGHNDAIDNGGGHQNLTGTVVAIMCGAGPTATPGGSVTPTPNPSATATPGGSVTPTPSVTVTPGGSVTPTPNPSATATPGGSVTPTPSVTVTPGGSVTPTPSATTTPGGSVTPTPTPMATPTPPFEGNFVIGDLNAVVGNHVTFWGSHWYQSNSMSGGSAPHSFKGFASQTNPDPTECGGTWTTTAGNSSHPPSDIPDLITVIAASSITQSGSTITGNVPMLAMVQTDDNSNSGDDSKTGTVVAVVCMSGPVVDAPLSNISTRLRVGTGENVLIGGFIVTGNESKRILLRASGPSLPFADGLADPMLRLRDSTGQVIATNDNWADAPNAQEIMDTNIPPADSLEPAILMNLQPGAYTAVVEGTNQSTGMAVVEAYDLNQTANSKLANISTRGLVQSGDDILIGGLIVRGQRPTRVVVRAVGPSLTDVGALSDPTLELRDSEGGMIGSNDNWRSDQEAEITASGLAPSNDLEAAISRDLPPGKYTAIIRGANGTTGVALVEVYGLTQ